MKKQKKSLKSIIHLTYTKIERKKVHSLRQRRKNQLNFQSISMVIDILNHSIQIKTRQKLPARTNIALTTV